MTVRNYCIALYKYVMLFQFDRNFYQHTFYNIYGNIIGYIVSRMIEPLAHLNIFYTLLIYSIHKSINAEMYRITLIQYYWIILITINTKLNARITILSDCYKRAVYRKLFTGTYVIYPEGGSIWRFRGHVAKWIPSYFVILIVCSNQLKSIY